MRADTECCAPPGPDTAFTLEELQSDALGFLQELIERYGDIVRYSADGWTATLLNRPDYIKHVLQDNHTNYTKEGTPDLMMLRPMLGEGLLTTEGETWVRQRRLAQPAFHRDVVATFGGLITGETRAMLERWQPLADSGTAFEVSDELTQLTTRIIALALFGTDVGAFVETFGRAVQAMNEYMGHFDPRNVVARTNFEEAKAEIDQIVLHIIAERRSLSQQPNDFLSMLLLARDDDSGAPLSDTEVRDQVMTMLMAGHETTAKALTWTLYLLDRNRDAAVRIRQEVQAVLGGRVPEVADLADLQFTWAVVQEALRLYPPVWTISRVARDDDVIGDYSIPAGSFVLMSPYTMHRHPDFWEAPNMFHPDRFAPERDAARPSFAFLPFSGGPRQCIGKSFASVELPLVLVTLLQRYDVRLVPEHAVAPEALVTLRPADGLMVTLHPAGD